MLPPSLRRAGRQEARYHDTTFPIVVERFQAHSNKNNKLRRG